MRSPGRAASAMRAIFAACSSVTRALPRSPSAVSTPACIPIHNRVHNDTIEKENRLVRYFAIRFRRSRRGGGRYHAQPRRAATPRADYRRASHRYLLGAEAAAEPRKHAARAVSTAGGEGKAGQFPAGRREEAASFSRRLLLQRFGSLQMAGSRLLVPGAPSERHRLAFSDRGGGYGDRRGAAAGRLPEHLLLRRARRGALDELRSA